MQCSVAIHIVGSDKTHILTDVFVHSMLVPSVAGGLLKDAVYEYNARLVSVPSRYKSHLPYRYPGIRVSPSRIEKRRGNTAT